MSRECHCANGPILRCGVVLVGDLVGVVRHHPWTGCSIIDLEGMVEVKGDWRAKVVVHLVQSGRVQARSLDAQLATASDD